MTVHKHTGRSALYTAIFLLSVATLVWEIILTRVFIIPFFFSSGECGPVRIWD